MENILKLQKDIENAKNIEEKDTIIANFFDNDHDLDVIKNMLTDYLSKELKDYHKRLRKEKHDYCNKSINSGKCEIYTCNKDIKGYKKGEKYYVKRILTTSIIESIS